MMHGQPHSARRPGAIAWSGLTAVSLLAASCAAPSAPRSGATPAPAAAARKPPRTDRSVEDLVRALGEASFAQRQAAEDELMDRSRENPAAVLTVAWPVWQSSRDPEVRTRLDHILRALFVRHVLNRPQGFLGVLHQPVGEPTPWQEKTYWPIRIQGVQANTPAEKAGLKPDDLILQYGDHALTEAEDLEAFRRAIEAKRPGDPLKLLVLRGGQPIEITVLLGVRDPNMKPFEPRPDPETRYREWLEAPLLP